MGWGTTRPRPLILKKEYCHSVLRNGVQSFSVGKDPMSPWGGVYHVPSIYAGHLTRRRDPHTVGPISLWGTRHICRGQCGSRLLVRYPAYMLGARYIKSSPWAILWPCPPGFWGIKFSTSIFMVDLKFGSIKLNGSPSKQNSWPLISKNRSNNNNQLS